MLLYSPLKFSICDIYHMFCAVLVDLFYTKFICILCKFYPVRSFDYRWNNKYESWNNIGSSTLNRHNSFNVVSTLFCQRWNNVDKHTLAQLSFSTKFQRWKNIGSSTLNRRNSIDVVSTLFCQRWNNAINMRPFNFHSQSNINVETTLMNVNDQRCFNVDSTLMCLLGSVFLEKKKRHGIDCLRARLHAQLGKFLQTKQTRKKIQN